MVYSPIYFQLIQPRSWFSISARTLAVLTSPYTLHVRIVTLLLLALILCQ